MLVRQYRLQKNPEIDKWELINQADGHVLKTYRTLKMALSRREIERAIDNVGLVNVHRRDGSIQILQFPIRTRR